MIESYDFGKIKIDGKEYSHDVIIYPEEVKDWWRDESHWVVIDDFREIVEKKPEVLVIGTGYSGVMRVSDEVKKFLEDLGMKVIIEPTKKACDSYNRLFKEKGVVAALHLTC